MNDTAVMVREAPQDWNEQQVAIIKQHIAPKIPDGELQLFAMVCKRTGLDPFARQIYTIKRGDTWTIQTGIDGYRLIAARSERLAGIDEAVYDTESADHPEWASVTVYRMVGDQRCPFTAKARWSEYWPGSKAGPMWQKMPYLMLGKCAEALALRKAFPAELSGVYTHDEMAQAEHDGPYVDAAPQPQPQPRHQPAPKPAPQSKSNQGHIRKLLFEHGFSTVQLQDSYLDNIGLGVKMQYNELDYTRLVACLEQLVAEDSHAESEATA